MVIYIYKSFELCSLLSSKWLFSIFWARNVISLFMASVLRSTCSHTPLKHRCPYIIAVLDFRHVPQVTNDNVSHKTYTRVWTCWTKFHFVLTGLLITFGLKSWQFRWCIPHLPQNFEPAYKSTTQHFRKFEPAYLLINTQSQDFAECWLSIINKRKRSLCRSDVARSYTSSNQLINARRNSPNCSCHKRKIQESECFFFSAVLWRRLGGRGQVGLQWQQWT